MDSCHVLTENLCRLAVVGEARDPSQPLRPVKRMKLAAFAPISHASMDYSIRVYCIEDTDATLQGVMQEEQKLGGFLLETPKEFRFQEGSNLCLCMEDIHPHWQIKPGANYQVIPQLSLRYWIGEIIWFFRKFRVLMCGVVHPFCTALSHWRKTALIRRQAHLQPAELSFIRRARHPQPHWPQIDRFCI